MIDSDLKEGENLEGTEAGSSPVSQPEVAAAESQQIEQQQAESRDGEPVDMAAEEPASEVPGDDASAAQEEEPSQASEQDAQPEGASIPDNPDMRWYVVHTYSGYENKARLALQERIKREGMDDEFGEILIPTEEVVEMKRGARRTSKRKFFPGYMMVQMVMSEQSWYLVKSTPKITGFVGGSTRPPPISESEVRRVTTQIAEGTEKLKPKVVFEKGDSVRVVDGPFSNFSGVIEEVESEKGKLRVLVSIFGRATPVEMDFVQVEKSS